MEQIKRANETYSARLLVYAKRTRTKTDGIEREMGGRTGWTNGKLSLLIASPNNVRNVNRFLCRISHPNSSFPLGPLSVALTRLPRKKMNLIQFRPLSLLHRAPWGKMCVFFHFACAGRASELTAESIEPAFQLENCTRRAMSSPRSSAELIVNYTRHGHKHFNVLFVAECIIFGGKSLVSRHTK